ncbi:MAG: hypothetical protein M1822_006434 [Bathelium mastoideum]|nr:MAG: hypothetical protein M1822_006434 [Bathelium mastoideum]
MAQYLAQQSRTPLTLTHFFQGAITRSSTKPVALAASILSQLLRSDASIVPKAIASTIVERTLALLDNFPNYEDCPFQQLWSVIKDLLVTLPEFTLIVDALDECSAAEEASVLAERLREMSALSHAQIITLSRPHPAFEAHWKYCTKIGMNEEVVSSDIVLFTTKEVQRAPKIRIAVEDIVRKAETDAHGMFLWAKLMLQYLQKAATPRIQRDRLHKFPMGLAPTYEKILEENGEKLEPEQVALRRSILMLLVAAPSPLTVDDISTALALEAPNQHPSDQDLLIDAREQISILCWPLIEIANGHVQLIHFSIREFLILPGSAGQNPLTHFTERASHEHVALKCFYRLIHPDARSLSCVEKLMLVNLGRGSMAKDTQTWQMPNEWSFYVYASTNWHFHLTNAEISSGLLYLASLFLCGQDFVTWVESFLHSLDDMGSVPDIRASLSAWHRGLDDTQKDILSISQFLKLPYNNFLKSTQKRHESRVVHFMAMRRVATYYNLSERADKGQELKRIRQCIAEGFIDTLGGFHPLSLRSVTDWCVELQTANDQERELLRAESLLLKTMTQQRECLGEKVSDSFFTQQYVGLSMFYRTIFDESAKHLQQSYQGLVDTLGPTHRNTVICRLYYAHALVGQSNLRHACKIYEEIWTFWSHSYGIQNPLSTMSQSNLGVTYRKLKKFRLAEKHLVESLAERQRMFGACLVTVDSCVNLAILYRDTNRVGEAFAHLDLADNLGPYEFGFERVCQIQHVRAMLHYDSKDVKQAVEVLRALLSEATAYPVNRTTLWIRLTLAELLRSQGLEEEALAFFSNIVKSTTNEQIGTGRRETPSQLLAAESALRTLKMHGVQKADAELRAMNLEWSSQESYWIICGGPAAEI